MNTESPTVSPNNTDRPILIRLALYLIVLHCGLLAYDFHEGFADFYRVDRADNRVDAMQNLLEAHTLADGVKAIAGNTIIVGEYIIQTGLFHMGGALAVILFQVALQFISVFAVYRIGRLLLGSRPPSAAAAFIYATLPHSLVFPHQFASEAIATPLVVFTFWILVEYLVADASWAWLLLAGGFCGFAACVRPVLMLLPAALALCVLARHGLKGLGGAVALVITGAIPPLLVVALLFSQTHEMSLGNKMSGMGYNLYIRVMRMTTNSSLSSEQKQAIAQRYFAGNMNDKCIGDPVPPDGTVCSLSPASYASYLLHYPMTSARYISRDVLSYVAKSGVSSMTANYFDLSANDEKIKDERTGWHEVWNSKGLLAAIVMVFNANPLTAVLEIAGSCLFAVLFVCFLAGCREIGRMRAVFALSRPRIIALYALALLPLYIFITSEVGEYMQSRYRNPAEFAICILAALGGSAILAYVKRRKVSG